MGVPEIQTSSGEEQAMAAYQAVEKWGLTDKIQAICCDTTASNTVRVNGACTNLEKLMGATSSPDMALFKRFREAWKKLDKNVYITGSNKVPDDVCPTILGFVEHYLRKNSIEMITENCWS